MRQFIENGRNAWLAVTDRAIEETRRFVPLLGETGRKFYEELNDRREFIQKLDDDDLEFIVSATILDPLVIGNNGEGFRGLLDAWATQNQERAVQIAAQL